MERLRVSNPAEQEPTKGVWQDILLVAEVVGTAALLVSISDFGFANWVKNLIWERQQGRCGDGCGRRIDEYHHVIPQRALLSQGIKGKDVPENCVGLSYHCHKEVWDQKMFDGEFFPGVGLEDIDPDTYITTKPKPQRHREKHSRHHRGRRS